MTAHTDRTICIKIDEDTFLELKLLMVKEGKSFQHLLAEFIRDYVDKKRKLN